MAVRAVAMDVRMAAALVGGVGNVTVFCERQGISRQTFYKWQRRVRAEGPDGLHDRSRRPRSSPWATAVEVEERVVRARKELADNGDYCGPASIRDRLVADARRHVRLHGGTPAQIAAAGADLPSRATIARILSRRGLVAPAPKKRPRSSYHRFQAARPNEMWQSDWTGWHLKSGKLVAIAGTLDDHSRLLAGIAAGAGYGTGELVWQVMSAAIEQCGVPMTSLTDNGRVYSLRRYREPGRTAFEINLEALGTQVITSTPYHPQTCGKIERFWQTLKKWLTAHGPYVTVGQLNTGLAEFGEYYNHERPHRALHGRTPAEAFAATEPARPAARPLPAELIVRRCTTSHTGVVPAGRNCLIALGAQWKLQQVTVIRDGDHATIYAGNRLIRELDVDRTRTYQPLGNRQPTTR